MVVTWWIVFFCAVDQHVCSPHSVSAGTLLLLRSHISSVFDVCTKNLVSWHCHVSCVMFVWNTTF